MKFIRNIPWEVGNIVPDFELGKTTCALYIRSVWVQVAPKPVKLGRGVMYSS